MSAELLDTDIASRMYIDAGELVRVRVEADEFRDDGQGPPKMTEGVQVRQEPRRARAVSDYSELGLGNVSWWNASQEEDAEGDVLMEE
ncbi:uncharacterized protein ARMOST_17116 [Armillaria ostoyae]|uniref:RNA polymerase III subunit Rpc25 domain-containing protein n=1 Tax=Armillaria ostoyae TaxID=47428 RepID=A0A284RY48_ARMOS|nr:uncharacterized protein ARMOST_17116 [Armillaria ostoyae]